MIQVRNRISGKIYTCTEEDFIRARKKGAALEKLPQEPPKVPTYKKIDPDPEPQKEPEKEEKKPVKKPAKNKSK